MFDRSPIFASFAVRDTDEARHFYRDKLGLDVRDSSEDGILEIHPTSGTPILVYPKPDHEPAVFTVLNLPVADVDAAVDTLQGVGVMMEHYDTDSIKTDERGIARGDGPTIAWFRDPSGNILSVLSESAS